MSTPIDEDLAATRGAWDRLQTPVGYQRTMTADEALNLVIDVAIEEYLTRPNGSLREALGLLLKPEHIESFGQRFTLIPGGQR